MRDRDRESRESWDEVQSPRSISVRARPALAIACAAALLAVSSPAVAQSPAVSSGAEEVSVEIATAIARYVVVVDLRENLLHFRYGDLTLWTAPVGTGTGLRLESDSGEWDFSTPTGAYHVQYKERDPVWIAPDWYYVENGLAVPPRNHVSRYFPGGLGVAAVYYHPSLAIHGTNRPELLGQRVSHGCTRLENRYALRLFHNVQAGTEVVIVGEDDPDPLPTASDQAALFSPGPATEPDDETARLRSLSTRALLDLLEALARMPPEERAAVAATLVTASLMLYGGGWDEPGAPWPTRRIPEALVDAAARDGWYALAAAEHELLASLSGADD